MRLRLVHQLSLLLLAAVLIAVMVMGAVVSFNLRQGFVDYLEAREAQRLDRFVQLISVMWANGQGETLRHSPHALRQVLDQLAVLEGLTQAPPEPPPAAAPAQAPRPVTVGEAPSPGKPATPPARALGDARPSPHMDERQPREHPDWPPHPPRPPRFDAAEHGPRPHPRHGPHPHPPPHPPHPPHDPGWDAPTTASPPPPPPEPPPVNAAPPPPTPPTAAAALAPRPPPPPPETHRWARRLSIEDANGMVWFGRPFSTDLPSVTRPLVIDGRTLGTVRLYLDQRIPDGLESRFLVRQYGTIAAVAGLLALLSLLVAFIVARRWVKPITAVRQAAQRIAKGEFSVRLRTGGQDELAELTRHMNAMAESLDQLEKARRRWIAELSHEIRTPLSVLRGELEALQDGIRPVNTDALQSLQNEVSHITRLVDDLHQLAMFDLKKISCQFAPIDATQLTREVVDRLRPKAHGLTITIDAPATLAVCWDAGRITQLITNLLENSIKYTDAPGTIALALRAEATRVILTVEDTPPGVKDFEYGALFEPLYRADVSRNRNAGGSGLGLAIVEAIARAHGGDVIALPSTLGGLAIEVSLPADPATHSKPRQP